MRDLNRKGIDDVRINHFTKLITFLSAQWISFPPEISSIIARKTVYLKLDLSQVKLSSPESLQSIIIGFFNCGNYLRRLDISGTKITQDISYVINQVLNKQLREKNERIAENEDKEEDEKERLDVLELEELNVSGNPFSIKGIEQIRKHGQTIRCFGFDKCGLDKPALTEFDRLFENINCLRVLSLEFNNMGNDCTKNILQRLTLSKTLYYLNISENMLNLEIVPTIVRFLSDNNQIEAFECERNM